MAYLHFHTIPPVILFSPGHEREDFTDYLCYPLLKTIGQIRTTVSIDGGGENASTAADLAAGMDLELIGLFAIPPLFAECDIFDIAGELYFSGFVTSVTLGENPQVRIES